MSDWNLEFEAAPYRLSGVVVGSLMNHVDALAALGEAAHAPPYKAPPKAPVLYVKPRNTLARNGSAVAIPAPVERLEVAASLAMVIGRTACRVAESTALEHVAGYTLVADIGVPHESFYRPSVRFKALDGSCLIGPRIALREEIPDPDDLTIRVSVDGVEMLRLDTAAMVRSAARLLADVSDFMTLRPGDLLMLGIASGAPLAGSGQTFAVNGSPIGCLAGRMVAEEGGPVV